MSIVVRAYRNEDILQMNLVWNEVVEDGIAFPQTEILDRTGGEKFFLLKATAVLPKIPKAVKLSACIFCTPTT